MVLEGSLIFQVLALDALGTGAAKASVQFVVMPRAVRLVVENVELSGAERFLASSADEASLVVLARESTISRRDTLALDRQAARLAIASARLSRALALRRRNTWRWRRCTHPCWSGVITL